MRILLLIFMLSFTALLAQHQEQLSIKDPVVYLLKNVLLENKDTGALVIIPLDTKNIKYFEPNQQVKFWGILEKYFPCASKDALTKMVASAQWLDRSLSLKRFTIYFPDTKEGETPDLAVLYKNYHYVPVFSISNPVYSKDRTTCIIYVKGYQEGPYTVEIKKDADGNWTSHTMITDWLI